MAATQGKIYQLPLMRLEFPKHNHFRVNKDLNPYLTHYYSSYTFHKDYCKKKYPNYRDGTGTKMFYDNCALAHINIYGDVLEVQKQAGDNALFDYS